MQGSIEQKEHGEKRFKFAGIPNLPFTYSHTFAKGLVYIKVRLG